MVLNALKLVLSAVPRPDGGHLQTRHDSGVLPESFIGCTLVLCTGLWKLDSALGSYSLYNIHVEYLLHVKEDSGLPCGKCSLWDVCPVSWAILAKLEGPTPVTAGPICDARPKTELPWFAGCRWVSRRNVGRTTRAILDLIHKIWHVLWKWYLTLIFCLPFLSSKPGWPLKEQWCYWCSVLSFCDAGTAWVGISNPTAPWDLKVKGSRNEEDIHPYIWQKLICWLRHYECEGRMFSRRGNAISCLKIDCKSSSCSDVALLQTDGRTKLQK